MKLNNPFLVRGYGGPEYFCDREEETARLVSSIVNDGDVTLISPRRYGKTGLIHHAFGRLPEEYAKVYLDIYATNSLADFSRELATSVVGALETRVERAVRGLTKFFRNCRPTIEAQESGMPRFSFDVVADNAEATLADTFEYLSSHKRRIVIAIDEFQQIREYPEKGVEALVRSKIQLLPWVRFVFAGSRQHMMREMFLSAKHPFYQSTDIMSLAPIGRDRYREFAEAFFRANRKPFSGHAFDFLYDMFDGVTWYVQMALRRLWADGWGVPDAAAVRRAVDDIVETRKMEFLDLHRSQTKSAQRLLKALAAKGPVDEPLSNAFLSENGLGAASTIASTLKRLEENDLVYRSSRGYIVYDRFYGLWLAKS